MNTTANTGAGSDQGIERNLSEPIWDALVVGAGPAGSLTAYELSRLGKRVVLVDRGTFPRWKVCGATLSPGAGELLSQAGLGDLLSSMGAIPLHTLRLGGWGTRTDLSLNGSVAISRTSLDSALIESAINQGARFIPGVRARLGNLKSDGRMVTVHSRRGQATVTARIVIAADGLGSGLMGQAGVPATVSSSPRRRLIGLGGVISSPALQFEAGVIHMAVGEEGYVGIVRVEDGSLNVAAALDKDALKSGDSPAVLVQSILQAGGWPHLPEPPPGGWKGTPELTRTPPSAGAERILAVGDAAGYVEPFTGEGMFWALSGARLLGPIAARAISAWDPRLLDEWTTVHGRLMGRAQRLCRATAWTLARPSLSRTLIGVLETFPGLARPVIRRVGAPLLQKA